MRPSRRFRPAPIARPFPLCAALIGTVLGLSGCGGGGGGAGDGQEAASSGAPAVQATVQASVDELPSSGYPAGSGELAAWTYFQSARTQCGFGALEQNTRLDAASRAHGKYLLSEGSDGAYATGHDEANVNNPFYTGALATDRAQFAGYGPYVVELLTASTETYVSAAPMSQPTAAARGERDMRSLLNSVAHLRGAMVAARVGGLAAVTKEDRKTGSDGLTTLVVNQRLGVLLGRQEALPLLGAGKVASYPCEGSVDIDYAFAPATEEPNPFPRITDPTVQMGPPIYLRADEGAELHVTSYTLKDSAGTVVPVRTNAVPQSGHEFFMVPRRELAPDARYSVDLEGTANGVNFHQQFDFRTRS
ncbi:hypothetical protein ACSFA2_22710 [Variovorax sp. LT2P21]|uniref:hypothetical protein n=1 Tax=Variovorax sp. LT2P21 TaxID=3443731 RepID=UPI003F46269A